jgi:hypothetical protein
MANTSTWRQWFIVDAYPDSTGQRVNYKLVLWIPAPAQRLLPRPGATSILAGQSGITVSGPELTALQAGQFVEIQDAYQSIPQTGMTPAQQQAYDLANIALIWGFWAAYYATLGPPNNAPSHAIGAQAGPTGTVTPGP